MSNNYFFLSPTTCNLQNQEKIAHWETCKTFPHCVKLSEDWPSILNYKLKDIPASSLTNESSILVKRCSKLTSPYFAMLNDKENYAPFIFLSTKCVQCCGSLVVVYLTMPLIFGSKAHNMKPSSISEIKKCL